MHLKTIPNIPNLGQACIHLYLWHLKKKISDKRMLINPCRQVKELFINFLYGYYWFIKEYFDELNNGCKGKETSDKDSIDRVAKIITKTGRGSTMF